MKKNVRYVIEIALFLVVFIFLIWAVTRGTDLGIKKASEYVVIPLIEPLDASGVPLIPDSVHIITYSDNISGKAFSTRSTTYPFSAVGIDTTKDYADTTYWFVDQIQDIDGDAGNFELAIKVTFFCDGLPTTTRATVQVIDDSLNSKFEDSTNTKAMFQNNWDSDTDGELSIEVLGTYVEPSAVLTPDVYTPQALTYDSTPNNENTGHAVHPDVLYEDSEWNGSKFWMVFTPPNAANENAQMLKGGDGRNWEWVCIIDSALAGEPHMSDPNLIWGLNQDTMWCFYNGCNNLLRSYSTDGAIWSDRDSVGVYFGTAPVPIYDQATEEYRLYYNSTTELGGSVRKLYYRVGTHWGDDFASSESLMCTIEPHIAGRAIWHQNIMPIQGGFHGLFVYCDSNTGGTNSNLHFARSTDGVTWTVSEEAILDQSTAATWDAGGAYQSAAIPLYKNGQMGYAVWYSAFGLETWHIGYTELLFLVQPDIFEIQVTLDSVMDEVVNIDGGDLDGIIRYSHSDSTLQLAGLHVISSGTDDALLLDASGTTTGKGAYIIGGTQIATPAMTVEASGLSPAAFLTSNSGEGIEISAGANGIYIDAGDAYSAIKLIDPGGRIEGDLLGTVDSVTDAALCEQDSGWIAAIKAKTDKIDDLVYFFGACDECYIRFYPEGGLANKDSAIVINPDLGADSLVFKAAYFHGTVPNVYDSAYYYKAPWWE